MNYGSLTQIAVLIISVAIIFTYIQPTFASIAGVQASIDQYQTTLDRAAEFNAKLRRLVGDINGFSSTDMRALETYLPADIDEVQVMADVVAIARQSGASISSLTTDEVQTPNEDVVINGEVVAASASMYQDFTLTVTADYDTLKNFLAKIEQNKYPLEVVSLSFGNTTNSGGTTISNADTPQGSYEMVLRTYAYYYQN